jgi:hypothetical protein
MTSAIDTISGMWVKPLTTTTYVVKQELECNSVKWDTVVVYINPLSVSKLKMANGELGIFPVPAKDEIVVDFISQDSHAEVESVEIFNNNGKVVTTLILTEAMLPVKLSLKELPSGIYYLRLKLKDVCEMGRTFVVEE